MDDRLLIAALGMQGSVQVSKGLPDYERVIDWDYYAKESLAMADALLAEHERTKKPNPSS